ncbi:MAG: GNAT family N-acetyltransferase [Patescibacteria group bacterium]|jgi:predicted N-acetyltransferase YhbS
MTKIRKATIEDVVQLENFQKQLHGKWFDACHCDLKQAILSGNVWIALDNDKIIGYQLCELFGPKQKNFPNSIFLSELFIIPEARLKGAGTLLVTAALNATWPSEYEYFSLTHDPNESTLTQYYEKFGFKDSGRTEAGNIKMTRPRTAGV